MVLNEIEFKRQIDCRFPYNDSKACVDLIDEAKSISHEAMFAVLHEICRAPRDETTPAKQLKLSEQWLSKATHPISVDICDVAKTMINGEDIPVDQSIAMLDKVSAEFPSLSSALHILYFACDDIDGKMDRHYNEIVKRLSNNTA